MSAKKRNFVSPIDAGNIEFIRPSKLEKPGVLIEATFVESLPNAFDNNKLDYKFSGDKGKTIILNGAGNLGYQMERINAGDFVQISYEGKKKIESGKMEGRMAHNFKVLVDKPE
jgi:hypothetical protein